MFSPPPRRSSDDESETEPLNSNNALRDYPFFWDRRYHNHHEASYLYPNDEPEQDRQDFEFRLLQKFVFEQNLFFAPIHEPRRILDVGTGTGIWAVEMAHVFPSSRVKAWDLSAIQPGNAPTNVEWELFDCTADTWFRHPHPMDYIHISMMFGAVSRYDELIRKAKDNLLPGTGWLECQELLPTIFSDHNSIPQDWAFGEWLDKFECASNQHVRPPRSVMIADKLKEWMERAGFVDVHEFVKKVPVGRWPEKKRFKTLGEFWRQNLEKALQGWSYKPLGTEGFGMSRNEVEVLLASARGDLQNRNVHGYQKIYVVYGRKPSSTEAKALKERGHEGAQMRNSVHPVPGATFPASKHGNAPSGQQSQPQPRIPRNSPASNGASVLASRRREGRAAT